MASLRKRGKFWYYRFTGADGQKVEKKGTTDKRVTEELARAAENEAARVQAGIADSFGAHRRTAIRQHAADYLKFIRSKGGTDKHADLTETRVMAVLDGCGFKALGDLDADKVSQWLADQRAAEPKGMSVATSNHYLQAVRSFGRWLVERERLPKNPLLKLKPMNDQADRRHDRAALSGKDFAALLVATRAAPVFRGLTGHDRAVLYTLAANTGLRASELASLTTASFNLDGTTPAVKVRAAYTKNGDVAEIPLRPELVTILRDYLSGREAAAPTWPGTWVERAAAMLKKDLWRAGLPYQDAEGKFYDFHSLRHRFGTEMALANVPPKIAQTLMRHSTITLTMDRYGHASLQDAADELRKLPPLEGDSKG